LVACFLYTHCFFAASQAARIRPGWASTPGTRVVLRFAFHHVRVSLSSELCGRRNTDVP
jgi:hypothetical protein